MNEAVYTLALDVHMSAAQGEIKVKRGDNVREIRASLYDGAEPYVIGDGAAVNFYCSKPSGAIVYNSCTVEGNVIVYRLTGGTTDEVGKAECEFRVTDASTDELLTSPRFTLVVDEVIYDDDAVEAEVGTEIGVLDELIGDSEAWAVGKRNGADVPSTDPAYRNNAKYYSDSAGASASSAATDAARAEAGVPVLYGTTTLVPSVILTEAQYQALVDAGTVDPGTLYLIYEEGENNE